MKNITNLERQLLIMKNNFNGIPRSICEAAYCAKHQTEDCRSIKQCQDCEFYNNAKAIAKVLLSEYKEKPRLTEDEKAILGNLPKRFKWIARDYNGDIFIFLDKPTRFESAWDSCGREYNNLILFNDLFKFIEFEDEEPYSIEELLKEE